MSFRRRSRSLLFATAATLGGVALVLGAEVLPSDEEPETSTVPGPYVFPAPSGTWLERLAATTVTAPYGWPVKPFGRQHSVRGVLGDPRINRTRDGRTVRALHRGVDIVAADGAPVYAVASGYVATDARFPYTVWVVTPGRKVFEYWHIVPTRRSGSVTANETVIGHVRPPWGHVHLGEQGGTGHLNPLRGGALGPYEDREPPIIREVRLDPRGHELAKHVEDEEAVVVQGKVDLVAVASDPPTLPVPKPWNKVRFTPALLRWRILGANLTARTRWHTAIDVRLTLGHVLFESVFREGTFQNRARWAGRYRFKLAVGWDTRTIPDGLYHLQVAAEDIRGNSSFERVPFVVANALAKRSGTRDDPGKTSQETSRRRSE